MLLADFFISVGAFFDQVAAKMKILSLGPSPDDERNIQIRAWADQRLSEKAG
jgi:hypothetical protein